MARLPDDAVACDCGVCGQVLLGLDSAHLKTAEDEFSAADGLPPVVFARVPAGPRNLPVCRECAEGPTRGAGVGRADTDDPGDGRWDDAVRALEE